MRESLRAFLAGAVDYAGFLPPARLPLDEVIANHARFRGCQDRWLLGRLALPAAQLDEMDSLAGSLFTSTAKVRLSVIIGGGETTVDFTALIERDLAAIGRFLSRYASRAQIDVLELKLPPHVPADWICEQTNLRVDPAILCFVEAAPGQLAQVIEAYQMRTFHGILLCPNTKSMEPDELAQPFIAARDRSAGRGIPLKFNLGSYRPLRASDGTYGFINLMAAGMLAYAHRLNADSLARILAERAPDAFRFDDDALRYGDWMLSITQIEQMRGRITSCGISRFDNAREKLRELGWL